MDFESWHTQIQEHMESPGGELESFDYIALAKWRSKILNDKIPSTWLSDKFTILPPDSTEVLEDRMTGAVSFGLQFIIRAGDDRYLKTLSQVRETIKANDNRDMVSMFNTDPYLDKYIILEFPNAFEFIGQ